ncbi:MAG: exodeoxyribonuclease VII small subunit [Gemmatimonadales bacterium]|jgi:exodeoxyribonuclease VII small subunit|nr:MAG: exodeoxyribonuclease VII small subunit [Gemmatimonadales bacterium]
MTDAREMDLGLEERLRRLETILAALESDELELEKSLELFEEGIGHIRAAEKTLSEATLRVEEVLSDGQTRSLDGEDGEP